MRFAQIIQKRNEKKGKNKKIAEIFLIRLYCIHAVNSRNKLHGVSVTTYIWSQQWGLGLVGEVGYPLTILSLREASAKSLT